MKKLNTKKQECLPWPNTKSGKKLCAFLKKHNIDTSKENWINVHNGVLEIRTGKRGKWRPCPEIECAEFKKLFDDTIAETRA